MLAEPLITLYDADATSSGLLTPTLQKLYDGDVVFTSPKQRPFVYSNFVISLDGIVSFHLDGDDTGNAISGANAADHAVMGILRACADAIVWGSGSYTSTKKFLSTPAAIFPKAADLFAEQRRALHAATAPLAVILTASGKIPMDGALLLDASQPTLIITTHSNLPFLQHIQSEELAVRVAAIPESTLEPQSVLKLLTEEYGIQSVLFEGGPKLLGAFLQANVIDEMFLTTAPQLVGHGAQHERPSLVEGYGFMPQTAPWLELRSLKRSGSVLFSHYRVVGPR